MVKFEHFYRTDILKKYKLRKITLKIETLGHLKGKDFLAYFFNYRIFTKLRRNMPCMSNLIFFKYRLLQLNHAIRFSLP